MDTLRKSKRTAEESESLQERKRTNLVVRFREGKLERRWSRLRDAIWTLENKEADGKAKSR